MKSGKRFNIDNNFAPLFQVCHSSFVFLLIWENYSKMFAIHLIELKGSKVQKEEEDICRCLYKQLEMKKEKQ